MYKRVALFGLIGGFALASSASATTIHVTKTTDGGKGSLRAAIDKAGSQNGSDTIVLGKGKTYGLTKCGPADSQEDTNQDGDLDYAGAGLTVKGRGSTIRNKCVGERIFQTLAPVASNRLAFSDLTMRGGNAAGGSGGALLADRGDLFLTNVRLIGNRADVFGGGVFTGVSATLRHVLAHKNKVGRQGGGVYSLGPTTLSHSTLSDNHAGEAGGGLYSDGGAQILMSTISGNVAESFGGGITAFFDGAVIFDSTIADNRVNNGSGGGYYGVRDANLLAVRSTIANNQASGVGGVFQSEDGIELLGSIVADNSGLQCKVDQDAIVSDGNNLSSDGSCNPDTNQGDLPNTAPKLKKLADNGGPVETIALSEHSPARNAGPGSSSCTPTDSRGAPRAGRCDIGAYEFNTCHGVVVNRVGTTGADTLKGTNHADGMLGLDGNDLLDGAAGNDALCGGKGNDKLDGGSGKDRCDGGPGRNSQQSCER